MSFQYRDHRGGFAESMETVQTFDTHQALIDYLTKSFAGFGGVVIPSAVLVHPFTKDDRNDWRTHIVTLTLEGKEDSVVAGFTDGPTILPMTKEDLKNYGFKSWDGIDKGPPEDWSRGWKVMHRGGYVGTVSTEEAYPWIHEGNDGDIIGYPTDESRATQTMDYVNHGKE